MPTASNQDVCTLALNHYGLVASAEPLAGELDLNFKLSAENGDCYVLKLHHGVDTAGVLEMQNAVLEHLFSTDSSLPVPRLIKTLNASNQVLLTIDGDDYVLRVLSWLDGDLWSSQAPDNLQSGWSLGRYLARLDKAMASFEHNAVRRDFLWDLSCVDQHLSAVSLLDEETRESVEICLRHFRDKISPHLKSLPQQVIHNDANDNNVLLDKQHNVCGLIDFGDVIVGHVISEVAIASAYMMVDEVDPVGAILPLVSAYHSVATLTDEELGILFDLIRSRIANSMVMAARQIVDDPENQYLLISQSGFRKLFARLNEENSSLVYFRLRDACGYSANPLTPSIVRWLETHRHQFANICDFDLADPDEVAELDLAIDGEHAMAMGQMNSAAEFTDYLDTYLAGQNAKVGLGRYLERRGVYKSEAFETADPNERRDRHLGVDLFMPAGKAIYAPIDGVVECMDLKSDAYDFGPVVILRHKTDDQIVFWTLYGHLDERTLEHLHVGQFLTAGDVIGWIGNFPINGDWPPHTHFQILTNLLGMGAGIHGVGNLSMIDVWESVCPVPDLILRLPRSCRAPAQNTSDYLLFKRRIKLGRMLSLSYQEPLKIVRGKAQYLFDSDGRRYLDMVNNVCHVGHCHPTVVKAGQTQMETLNTNTRYLHDNIVELAKRLTMSLPDPLGVCFFVNSGSEANDLALRLARNYTDRQSMLVLEQAYHGNLGSLIDISPYKFAGKGGRGCPSTTWVSSLPDRYRGQYRYENDNAGPLYAESVAATIKQMHAAGQKPAAFIAESLGGVSGQTILPPDYLKKVYALVREVGGVCIADEVQVGLGRMGHCMWGFETQQVVPDIVTIGKPLGNGHPIAAVVTTTAIAEAFCTGMEYFNTFGGNPVSCAIGLAVFDAIRQDDLMANAILRGDQLKSGLAALQQCHPLIGDVRGIGLFVGAELVKNRSSLEPATEEAGQLLNFLKTRDILLSTDGKFDNTLKIKPPICLSEQDVDHFLNSLDEGLTAL
jgi:4-aminobutyrate aminotransferase-like enzyme/Ser/Thr protein kinase RdoA (MazF antagonist)